MEIVKIRTAWVMIGGPKGGHGLNNC